MYLYANVSGEYYDALPEGITTSNSLLNILLDILWIRGVSGTNARENCLHYTTLKIEDVSWEQLGANTLENLADLRGWSLCL